MSPLPDIRTLMFFNGFTAFVMFICMAHVVMRRRTSPGFNLWTWAAFLSSVGFVLYSLRSILPDSLTIITANMLVVLAGILICRGLVKFCGRPQANWLDLAVLAAMALDVFYFTLWRPDTQLRISIFSVILGLLYLRAFFLAIGPVGRLLGERNVILGVSLGLVALWCLARSVTTWLWDDQLVSIMSAGPYHRATFLAMIAGHITMMVGLISINSSRLEKDLTSALHEIKTLRGIIPICTTCKKIRDDQGYWQQVESYVRARTDAEFTHSICPDCLKILYPELKINQK
jgi:hypothetical protein